MGLSWVAHGPLMGCSWDALGELFLQGYEFAMIITCNRSYFVLVQSYTPMTITCHYRRITCLYRRTTPCYLATKACYLKYNQISSIYVICHVDNN